MTYEQLSLDYQKIFREGDSQEARKAWEANRNAQMKVLEKDVSLACTQLALAIADEFDVQDGILMSALRRGMKAPDDRISMDLSQEPL